MKIISYNVNGIRAASKKDFVSWLASTQADVVCIQETKALKEQVDMSAVEALGYHHYWFSAQKKDTVASPFLSKLTPTHIEYGTGIDHMDFEGRVIRADYDNCSVISLYLPSGTNVDRLSHKFKFMDDFKAYIDDLKQAHPNLVICGDYNICHQAIDIHDPVRNKNVSGFLPRGTCLVRRFFKKWLYRFLSPFKSRSHHYSWWSYRANARVNNKGWRIDYALVSQPLKDTIERAYILPEAYHSDHCPVVVELRF